MLWWSSASAVHLVVEDLDLGPGRPRYSSGISPDIRGTTYPAGIQFQQCHCSGSSAGSFFRQPPTRGPFIDSFAHPTPRCAWPCLRYRTFVRISNRLPALWFLLLSSRTDRPSVWTLDTLTRNWH